MKDTPYTQNMAAYAENTDTTGIDSSDYSIGAQINKCIPAKWWNTLFGDLVRRVRQSRSDFNAIYQEFLNVLSEADIEPDETESDQLLQALAAIRDNQPLATHNSPGFVKSAGGKVNVSVNPSTGIMTANGVGSISNSTSGIATNPSVTDIISALTYLSNNVSGKQLVIPAKPENWQVAVGDYYIYETNTDATNQNLILLATKGTSYFFTDIELDPGWYRFVFWGGSGGKGGAGGNARGYYTGSSVGGGISGTQSGNNGKSGAIGLPPLLYYIDMYLPTKTNITGCLGGGGNTGSTGLSPNSGGTGWGSGSGAGGAATVINEARYKIIASRFPMFIQGLAGASGSAAQTQSFSFSTSGASGSGTMYCGGGGGGGGNGGGTFIRVGNVPLYCCGSAGGAGGGRDSARYTTSTTYTPSTYPGATGGAGGDGYSSAIRVPYAVNLGLASIITERPHLLDQEPYMLEEGQQQLTYAIDAKFFTSVGVRSGDLTKIGNNVTATAGNASAGFTSSYSLNDGFPGGLIIFRGANA